MILENYTLILLDVDMMPFCYYFSIAAGNIFFVSLDNVCEFARSTIRCDPSLSGRFLMPSPSVFSLSLQTTHGDIIHQLVNDSLNYYYVARVQVPPYHTIVHCCSKVRAWLRHSPHSGSQEGRIRSSI